MNLIQLTEVRCDHTDLVEESQIWLNTDHIEKITRCTWLGKTYYLIHTGRTMSSVADSRIIQLLTDPYEVTR